MSKLKYLMFVLLSASFLHFAPADSLFLDELIRKSHLYNQNFPQERVHLHLNKTVFKPGEDLWFKAYIVESIQHYPSSQSADLSVKLIDENGHDVYKNLFNIKKGVVRENFRIPNNLKEGIYRLAAYTNWMQNGSVADVFSQKIIVVNSFLPRFFIHIELDDSLYDSNDSVQAKIKVRSRDGKNINNLKIKYAAKIDNNTIKKGAVKTGEQGAAQIQFTIPNRITHHLITLNL